MLLIDQSLKKHVAFEKDRLLSGEETESKNTEEKVAKLEVMQQKYGYYLNVAILVTIIVGTIQYMYLQWVEYKSEFSFLTFFMGITKCKDTMPNNQPM